MYTQIEIDQKRVAILEAYPNSRRMAKLVPKMAPEQVIAIYKSLQERGKLR